MGGTASFPDVSCFACRTIYWTGSKDGLRRSLFLCREQDFRQQDRRHQEL